MTTRRSRQATERGIALLMVVTVLVTLVLVAIPFAISMRMGHERTISERARDRAYWEAEQLLEGMKHAMAETHPSQEQVRWDAGERSVTSDPKVDSLDEITLGEDFRDRMAALWVDAAAANPAQEARLQALEARGLGPLNDDSGSIWTGIVEDANGKVNPTGSVFLTANLFGSALLAEDLDPASPDISVDNVAQAVVPGLPGFPPDGGWIRIDREVIEYESFDGSTFRGCNRGVLQDTPLADNGGGEEHERMTAVIDYAAYKIATHLIAARPGYLTPLENLEDLRSVGSWGGGGTLARERLDPLRRFLTVWSRRETGEAWLAPQVVANELPSAADSSAPDEVILKDLRNPAGTTAFLNAGTLVKITDGLKEAYQTVAWVGDSSRSQRERVATLAGPVGGRPEDIPGEQATAMEFEGGETSISCWAPYPININTAPREVLYAVMANLHFLGADTPEQIVTAELAWSLSEMIVDERKGDVAVNATTNRREGGPFRHAEDWGRWLNILEEGDVLTRAQRTALYFNAVNPHNFMLSYGTAPWCYRSMDVYHLEARVTVNDRGGEHMASATAREIVEIGSDAKSALILDSQDDFERRLSMGSGAKWVATSPRGVNFRNRRFANLQPALREYQAVLYGAYPSSARSDEGKEYGDVRLEPARIDLPGNTIRTVAQHFDTSVFTEGWRTDYYGGYPFKTADAFGVREGRFPQPFTLSFWWKSGDGDWAAFDCGMAQFMNRTSIFVMDGEEGSELVFRVCGATLEERGAEIAVPLSRINFQKGTWYHIQVSARGEDPSQMELLVDGVSVGRRRTLTWLASEIAEEDDEISVETTDGFSLRGAIMVGDEVVEYDERTSESFRACWRGARGTHDVDKLPGEGRRWQAGTPVRQLGYSAAILTDVMKGGSSLASPLGRWAAVRVNNAEDEATYTSGNVSLIYKGINANQSQFDAAILPLWGLETDATLEMGWADGFGESGIALLGSEAPFGSTALTADGQTLGGWEFVHYTRSTGDINVIHIERRGVQRDGWTPTENYFLPTVLENATLVDPAAGGALPEFPTLLHAYLVPITIPASASSGIGDDYLDPSNPTEFDVLARYGRNWDNDDAFDVGRDEGGDEALLCVGLPTDEELPEIIRYGSIDRQTGADTYFVAEDYVVGFLAGTFFPGAYTTLLEGVTNFDVESDPEAASERSQGQGGEVDIPPPGEDVEIPDDDPTFDTHSGGDAEMPTDFGFEGDLILATRNLITYDPPLPDRRGGADGEYPWPAWGPVHNQVNLLFRGARGTNDREHPEGNQGQAESMLMPCFRVDEGPAYIGEMDVDNEKVPGRPELWRGGRPVGRGDVVTLTNGDVDAPQRFLLTLRWADPFSRWVAPHTFPETRITAPETDAITQSIFEPRGRARMLRFPCGELPDELPRELDFAQSRLTGNPVVTAILDEVNIYRHSLEAAPLVFLTEEEGITETDETIRVTLRPVPDTLDGVPGYNEEAGILSLDGELIVYRGASQEGPGVWVLESCTRGVLGTEPRPHGYGGYGRFVTDVPVSYLQGNLARDGASLDVPTLDEAWPREGLLRIVGTDAVELVHYTRRTDNSILLAESLDADESLRGRGLMRGRFGTDVIDHYDGELIFWQPFRYWDRYLPRRSGDSEGFSGIHDHPDAAFLEIGTRIRSAYWHRIAWKEDLEGAKGGEDDFGRKSGAGETSFLDIVVVARLNPRVRWDSDRIVDLRGVGDLTTRRGSSDVEPSKDVLYLFDDPEGANAIGIESDTLEMRVYFVYHAGAFTAQDLPGMGGGFGDAVFENAWKQTPWLREIFAEVTSRTTSLSKAFRR